VSERSELDADLRRLNAAVDAATTARKRWMDAHMTDYAKYQVGDVLFDLETGQSLGPVARLYRIHEGDVRYDTSMYVYYTFRSGLNTSGQSGLSFGTHDEYVRRCADRLRWAEEDAATKPGRPA